jgi:hypothetical protein
MNQLREKASDKQMLGRPWHGLQAGYRIIPAVFLKDFCLLSMKVNSKFLCLQIHRPSGFRKRYTLGPPKAMVCEVEMSSGSEVLLANILPSTFFSLKGPGGYSLDFVKKRGLTCKSLVFQWVNV